MKDQIVFDITDATTIADSDQIGAVVQGIRSGSKELINSQQINSLEWLNVAAALHAGDGTAITQTGGALDVNLSSPLTIDVDLDGDYDVSTNATPDSAGMIAHDRAASPTNAQQNQRPTANTWVDVASADLATVHALDVNSFLLGLNDTSGDAQRLLIADSSDGLKVHIAGTDLSSAGDEALANTNIANAAKTLATAGTAETTVTSPLSDRKYLHIYNNANKKVFLGASGVSASNGFPLSPGSTATYRAGASVSVYYVGQTGDTPEIRTLELS